MKAPSTGKTDSSSLNNEVETGCDHPTGSGQTRASVDGEKSPRMPHERDESTDTSAAAPSKRMRIAHDDAESPKVPTDKSRETDAAYSTLRGKTPGAERDQGGS